jgi:gluconokinase
MVVPQPARDESGRLFCYALTDDAWVVGGAVSNGGIAARWAGGVFGQGAGRGDGELLEWAASIPAGSDGLVMLPYLLAERAPLWDPSVPGAFLGVRHSHTSGHFVRAAVEGVALQLSAIMLQLERFEPVTSIRATGGVFRAPLWRSVMAAALGRPFTVSGRAEGSALGAAALGLLATGRAESLVMAVEQLAPGVCAGSGEVVPVSAQDLAAYERIRTDLPHLLSSYREVADLFASVTTDR